MNSQSEQIAAASHCLVVMLSLSARCVESLRIYWCQFRAALFTVDAEKLVARTSSERTALCDSQSVLTISTLS